MAAYGYPIVYNLYLQRYSGQEVAIWLQSPTQGRSSRVWRYKILFKKREYRAGVSELDVYLGEHTKQGHYTHRHTGVCMESICFDHLFVPIQ